MADKFPEIDSVESPIEGDFLQREKELLGDEFGVSQNGVEEEEDEFDEPVTAAVEEPESAPQEQEQEQEQKTEYSAPIVNQFENLSLEDSTHVQQWKESRQLEISQREEAASRKEADTKAEAQKALDDFYENYNNKKEESVAASRKDEAKLLETRDKPSEGTVWDKAVALLNLKSSKSHGEGKGRMADLLVSLKGKSGVPGAI
ncbi:Clc1 protein [Martiniozyma asiatica (nom. inval.)]|nr:Clc1 protein [Martiniozyma asiatica]